MTNGIAGPFAVAVPLVAAGGDPRPDEDAGQVSFASLFAGAAQALVQQPVRLIEKPEGTSELDASCDADDVEDADDTGELGDTANVDDTVKADAADAVQPAPAQRDLVPNGIDRSIATLDPVLQEKLGRVMARMREETGHDVQVGETYRSQSRQNVLYAQGRSAPGPVVTWTQNSKHTQGRAVDLLVDGGSAGSDAYAALRRIATEEGLRTLGERDPGHLELPTNLSRATATQIANVPGAPAAPVTRTIPVSASSIAEVQVARVAQLAPTARVVNATIENPAEVARVAAVARPGVANSVMRAPAAQPHIPTQVNASAVTGQPTSANQQFGEKSDGRSQQNSGDRDGAGYGYAYSVSRRPVTEFTVPNLIATSAGTSAAQRAADIVAIREDAPARPLSQIVMAVDAGNGTTDRIQVDLRGSSLNAAIDTGDEHAARTMGAHKSELVHALTRDGLEVDSIDIRAATAHTAPVAAESAHRSSDSSSQSRSERGAAWQQQQHNRQRSENERRQQQRDERGGKK